MNRVEKEEYVIRLYRENKSIREIAKVMHMSFRNIGAIIRKVKLEADGKRGQLEDNDVNSKSKTTQAIKLFSEGNSPVEVAIAFFRLIKYLQYTENFGNLKGCMD